MTTASTVSMTGKRILLVEDEYFIAKGFARDLRRAGADVIGPVATVDEALALVAAGPIDGAVLDVNLRGEMAYPVADALVGRGAPFVFATGYSSSALPGRYAAVARCDKPVEVEALAAALFGVPG